MSALSGAFSLTNGGYERKNCTLTTLLFPATFQIMDFEVGDAKTIQKPVMDQVSTTGVNLVRKPQIFFLHCFPSIAFSFLQCNPQDYVEIGGSADMETTFLDTNHFTCDANLKVRQLHIIF